MRRGRNDWGYIYLYHMNGYYKIGSTSNLDARVQALSALPFAGWLVHDFCSEKAYIVEAAIHERLRDYRMRGEWYTLPPDIVNIIRQVEEANSVEELPEQLRVQSDPNQLLQCAEVYVDDSWLVRVKKQLDRQHVPFGAYVRDAVLMRLEQDEKGF